MMDLPDYFIADLPAHAELSPRMITEACQTLRRNREQYLLSRPTQAIVDTVCEVAHNWLQPDDPFREMALAQGVEATGFSRATLERGLDALFKRVNYAEVHALLVQELGQVERLDRFVVTEAELKTGRTAMATGPETLVHFTAGNIPTPPLLSIMLGLLARSAQFVKCSRGHDLLPRLYAHSLYAIEPKLAACLELATWEGGNPLLEAALFDQADCVTVQGNNETLADIQSRLPQKVRFLRHGHRVSFGYLTREVLSRFHAKELAAQAASDVAAWDQLGCLSPHVFYVESGGSVTPELFGQLLADQLQKLQATEPRGLLSPETDATVASRQSLYELRAANSPDTCVWRSEHDTTWTVVLEGDPRFQASCLHRFVYVKGVSDLTEALRGAAAVQGAVSTVALAAMGARAQELAVELARWGVTRLCPVGSMQDPPLPWRHDGRPTLGDLVVWTDWEQ
jgi:hypothetical protein